jgi:uncharacterized protein YcbK (DUF882 family)
MNLSPHFKESEFTCHCGCGDSSVSPKLIALLELIRDKSGEKAVTIVSGKRCKKHNEAVGGAKNSQHVLGDAADIRISGIEPRDVGELVRGIHARNLAHIGGIGQYKTFVHVDVRDGLARWNG